MTARVVVLEGGSPWGFRMHGGVDVQQPLRISRVNPGSKSSAKGIREGDIITSINNKSTREVTNSEAQAVLKNAGETLVLGLNRELRTASKRRSTSKIVHLETTEDLCETRTSATSVTTHRNISDSNDANHQFSAGKINGVGETKETPENPVASQPSTISSNCSSSPSTVSVYSDVGGTGIRVDSSGQDNTAARIAKLITTDNVIVTNLADKMGGNLKSSFKKRTRINSNNSSEVLVTEMKAGDKNTILERFQPFQYRVDSPETVPKKPKLGQTPKSRSLDDDDFVQITELSEVSESEDNKDCGVVVEVESDDNSNCKAQLTTQDEQSLRNYLGGLNLATSSYKERKARTRAALAEHFMPVLQEPKFLEVINEECSDSGGEHQLENRRRSKEVGKLGEPDTVQNIIWDTILAETGNPEVVYIDADSDGSDSDDEQNFDQIHLAFQLTPPPTPDSDETLTPFTETKKTCHNPEPLRALCIKELISLPFGRDIFQELAAVSQSIHDFPNWQQIYSLTLQKLRNYGDSSENKEHKSNRLLEIILENKSSSSPELNINGMTHCFDHHTTLLQRRLSLPEELFQRQLDSIREKERQLQDEIEKLEKEKRQVLNQMGHQKGFDESNYYISKKGDYAVHNDEVLRQKMYEEYMSKIQARQERKLHKIIKISSPPQSAGSTENLCEITHPDSIGNEFMCKVQERMKKLGVAYDESKESSPNIEESNVLIVDGHSHAVKEPKALPKHLREFFELTERAADCDGELAHGIWSPGHKATDTKPSNYDQKVSKKDDPIPPIWTPRSAGSSPTADRKEFKPVNFDSPILGRKHKEETFSSIDSRPAQTSQAPWRPPPNSSEVGEALSDSLGKRLPTSHSAPASGFSEYSTPRLPKAQNPTITLLQKAREGQLPKGASYLQHADSFHSYRSQNDRPPIREPGDVLYQGRNEYPSEFDTDRGRKMVGVRPKRYDIDVGATGSDGVPLGLRSEVKEANQSRWYKKMYDTIHKQKPDRDYVTVRYKQRRARYPYISGYFSEPDQSPGNFSAYYYDSDGATSDNKYSTLDRRRYQHPSDKDYVNDYHMSSTLPRDRETLHSDVIKHGQDVYRNQPGRIENYIPGRSSISEKEAKEWWDEVMDIFDGHLDQQRRAPAQPKSFINQALKESGYESDSTLIFKRREVAAQQLSPTEQREAYKTIQKGGDVPLQGLRKLAPERPKEPEAPTPPPKGHQGLHFFETESPRKYVENEVTIHYKTPVRQEVKESLGEEELSRRQAEHMKRVYEEERRRKYLQELQDINNRRHSDNFTPSQKSPISLHRYDDFPPEDAPRVKQRPKSPEPRLIARALYNFVGQSVRELTFRKGDIIYIRRQVDKNWYEGEQNAMIGLFPANYVEIIPFDGGKSTPRKPYEGQARAKFNFIAQTNLELSLAKGELVVIIRRVDDNWYEGRVGGRKGIFPVSYVEVLIDPATPPPTHTPNKPVSSPAAHSLLLNGSAGGKDSMGSHSYTPSIPYQQQFATNYRGKPQQNGTSYSSLSKSVGSAKNSVNQTLHIDTHSEPIPYRALYKYRPQNEDELELFEGDIVFVLEKCDDGWYVGSSQRTGAFGTFPGNYVERV